MQIYIYAIIDSNEEIDTSIKEVEGAMLFNITYQDIGAVSGNIEKKIEETEEHILEHEKVAETLMDKFTVLPVRFNTIFKTREESLNMLKDYYSDFSENLKRLRHKVEFGLKVIWPSEEIKKRLISRSAKDGIQLPDNSPAKIFFKRKFKEYKIEEAFKEEANKWILFIDNFFNTIAVERKLQKLQTEKLLLNAYYLVTKENQDDFMKAFEKLKDSRSDLKYLFSGPWPPYNFIILTKKSHPHMSSLAERL